MKRGLYGFASVGDGSKDAFVSSTLMYGLADGDRVAFDIRPDAKGRSRVWWIRKLYADEMVEKKV